MSGNPRKCKEGEKLESYPAYYVPKEVLAQGDLNADHSDDESRVQV